MRRTALLVDGDNLSSTWSGRILVEARGVGRPDVVRVYVAANRPDWTATPGYRAMLAGPGKNAADLLLSIDAMELATIGQVEAFVIATSDRDFTHLVHRLREHGRHVLGLGEPKAPETFRQACSQFHLLDGEPTCRAHRTPDPGKLDRQVRHMIGARGIRIMDLGRRMHVEHGVRIASRPERTWRKYLQDRPSLYRTDPRGPEAMVHLCADAARSGDPTD